MDFMFTLHAVHEMNCSTPAVRHLTSSGVAMCTAIACVVRASFLCHGPWV
jgi:citrate synthase